jgi:hypothetical protein
MTDPSIYNLTLNEIVTTAFEELTIIAPGEELSGEDYNFGVKQLNLMLKQWQSPIYGLHLWLYDEVTLFLNQGQQYYTLGGPNSDRVATNIRLTALSGDANVLDTTIGVNSASGMSVGDYIGINLNNGTTQWSTITQIVANVIMIADALNDYALQGNTVFSYENPIERIFEVDNVRVIQQGGISPTGQVISSLLMFKMSRQQFFSIPNRNIQATPIQYFPDRRKNDMRLWVFGTGSPADLYLEFTAKRPLAALTTTSGIVDFPQEWVGPIVDNLAVRLASTYEKEFKVGNTQSFGTIAQRAAEGLDALRDYDIEEGSIYIQPRLDDWIS